jgi:hypothetical protein
MNRRHAKVALPAAYQGTTRSLGRTNAPLVTGVVETVSVPVPAVAPLMLTGDVVPKLNVGGLAAPDGLDVSAALNVTLPVKPPVGVIVIVDVLPVVAPGFTEIVPLLPRAKVGGGTKAVTVTPTTVVCVTEPAVPVTVTE